MFRWPRSHAGESRRRIAQTESAWCCARVQIAGRKQERPETQGKTTGGNARSFFDELLRPCVSDRLRLAIGGIVNNNLLRGSPLQREAQAGHVLREELRASAVLRSARTEVQHFGEGNKVLPLVLMIESGSKYGGRSGRFLV